MRANFKFEEKPVFKSLGFLASEKLLKELMVYRRSPEWKKKMEDVTTTFNKNEEWHERFKAESENKTDSDNNY